MVETQIARATTLKIHFCAPTPSQTEMFNFLAVHLAGWEELSLLDVGPGPTPVQLARPFTIASPYMGAMARHREPSRRRVHRLLPDGSFSRRRRRVQPKSLRPNSPSHPSAHALRPRCTVEGTREDSQVSSESRGGSDSGPLRPPVAPCWGTNRHSISPSPLRISAVHLEAYPGTPATRSGAQDREIQMTCIFWNRCSPVPCAHSEGFA
jgi:hypothetical protein